MVRKCEILFVYAKTEHFLNEKKKYVYANWWWHSLMMRKMGNIIYVKYKTKALFVVVVVVIPHTYPYYKVFLL